MTVASVYALFADMEEAERICRTLVEERLAACANILAEVRSIYAWQGAVQSANEVAAILKTRGDRVEELIVRVADLHSYEIPCVVSWPVDKVAESYAAWVEESVR